MVKLIARLMTIVLLAVLLVVELVATFYIITSELSVVQISINMIGISQVLLATGVCMYLMCKPGKSVSQDIGDMYADTLRGHRG